MAPRVPVQNTPGALRGMVSLCLVVSLLALPLTSAVAEQKADKTTASTEKPAIKVADQTVSKQEFQQKVNRQVQRLRQQRRAMSRAKGQKNNAPQPDTTGLKQKVEQKIKQREVSRLILMVHAEKANIAVSDSDVQAKWDELAQRVGSEETLRKKLKQNGETPESFRQQLTKSIRIEKFVRKNVPEPVISDTEVRSFYEQNKDRMRGRKFKQARPVIEQQLKQMKQRKAIQQFVRKLREETDVQVNV